ncbi:MAG: YidB family protein [Elusimicrobiota bacterium]
MDSLKDAAMSKLGSAIGGSDAGIETLIKGFIQQQGGLSGLIKMFQEQGLGNIANSLQNQAGQISFSPDQIGKLIQHPLLQSAIGKLGLSSEDVTGKLVTLLPKIISQFKS